MTATAMIRKPLIPIGQAIQDWRARLGVTRNQAAALLLTPRSTLDGWIAGKSCRYDGLVRTAMRLIEKYERPQNSS